MLEKPLAIPLSTEETEVPFILTGFTDLKETARHSQFSIFACTVEFGPHIQKLIDIKVNVISLFL
jgi:hypothetical protein